jgi:replicative DNA helicase
LLKTNSKLSLTPPCAPKAEKAVLGIMLRHNPAIDQLARLLKADDFHTFGYGKIFAQMVKMRNQGRPADIITLDAWLQRSDLKDDNIDLTDFWDDTLSPANGPVYAGMIDNCSVARQILQAVREIEEKVRSTNWSEPGSADRLLDFAMQRLREVQQHRSDSATRPMAVVVNVPLKRLDRGVERAGSKAAAGPFSAN